MNRHLAGWFRWLALAFHKLADCFDPSELESPRALGPGPQETAALALLDDMRLREALRLSLRRYSPTEPPARA